MWTTPRRPTERQDGCAGVAPVLGTTTTPTSPVPTCAPITAPTSDTRSRATSRRSRSRALQVTLTDEGVELLRRMWPVYAAGIEEHFARPLGRSAKTARAALERLSDAGAPSRPAAPP